MIGFIALAGIIVRNSILLVEFAREKVGEGWDVREAVLTARRVRLRPIMITALALVIGSMVLLDDPIFQGMAVSLLFGSLVATFLTLIVIPLGCISARKYFKPRKVDDDDGDDGAPPRGPVLDKVLDKVPAPARLRPPRHRAPLAAPPAWCGAAKRRPRRPRPPRKPPDARRVW